MGEIFILRDDLKMEEVDYEVRGRIISIIPHTEIFIQFARERQLFKVPFK